MNIIHFLYRLFGKLSGSRSVKSLSPALQAAKKWRQKGLPIGENTYLYNVTFGRSGRDPIKIGKNCVLVNCTILGHDASTNHALGISKSITQPVVIEDDCFIGQGAIILMGVTVGQGSVVGAGSVVTSNVPPGTVVAGNPAEVISTFDSLVERRKRLALEHPECFRELPDIG
jgi:acetyltransferase-like isoleucine patch superfamily enzyme